MKFLLLVIAVLFLVLGVFLVKSFAQADAIAIDIKRELQRRCPSCIYFVTEGDMNTPDGIKKVVFVLIADTGVTMRVERFQKNGKKGEIFDVVVIYFPKGVKDLGMEKFLKGLMK